MSDITNPVNTGQQMITNYDVSKIFLWNNRFENDNYVNNSNYNPVTLRAGTVMGRVALTNVLVPCDASQIDGSQFPIGILAQDMTISGGQTIKATICVSGDVAAGKVIFFTGNTLETIVAGRRMKDRIQSDSVGIKLVFGSTEMTSIDNQ